MRAVIRQGSGESPNRQDWPEPARRSLRTSHQPQGSNSRLAPSTRAMEISKGDRPPPRAGSPVARAITMKEVQMMTVTTAAARPKALGEKRAAGALTAFDMSGLSVAG